MSASHNPQRLHVKYSSPGRLLSELTRCIGQGHLSLPVSQVVSVGHSLLLSLSCPHLPHVMEISASVLRAQALSNGRHMLHLFCDSDFKGLESVLEEILKTYVLEKARRHPRLPIVVMASEETPYSPRYVIRDISQGGLHLQVEAPALPANVVKGSPISLQISFSKGTLHLPGKIVWTYQPPKESRAPVTPPSFGVALGFLTAQTEDTLSQFLKLKKRPLMPWKAHLRFGVNALTTP